MISLVTLQEARDHLRVPDDYDNADVKSKADQASATILRYLKGRAHESTSTADVSTSSVASPTVVTTVSPHGFSNGDEVFISGHVGSVPNINGLRTIADASGSTFTIPVSVTTAGAGGKVSVTWTSSTVPADVKASVLLLLDHLWAGDPSFDDTWQAIERLLMGARDPALA